MSFRLSPSLFQPRSFTISILSVSSLRRIAPNKKGSSFRILTTFDIVCRGVPRSVSSSDSHKTSAGSKSFPTSLSCSLLSIGNFSFIIFNYLLSVFVNTIDFFIFSKIKDIQDVFDPVFAMNCGNVPFIYRFLIPFFS